MAEVYLAEQCSLGRRVALKILKPELAGDPTYVKRFEREARSAASLVHANIVQIHEVGHLGAYHFIVQEYVPGQNLREQIARHGPLDLPTALAVMRQVAAALAKAADEGVVHRDIKPENILFATAGEVKVADFGLARLLCEDPSAGLTQVGLTVGTPLYMSPEQAEGHALDPRSDIYSFGVTCYHMLSGSPPFRGETALSIAVQHLKTLPPPLEGLRPDLPAPLCRAVHKMLAKDPTNRYQSPRELLQEIYRLAQEFGCQWTGEVPGWESAAAGSTVAARPQLTQQLDRLMKTAATARSPRRRTAALLAGAIVAFLAGGVAAWTTIIERDIPPPPESHGVSVPRQETVLQQWYYASEIGTEEAWQSLNEYFPEKQYFVRRAKQQLARIYLRKSDYDRALAAFRELAALEESEQELRAFGLAGECGVLSLEGKYAESAAIAEQLRPLRNKLKDPQMQKLVAYAIRKNRSQMGTESSKQWGKWLDEQFGP